MPSPRQKNSQPELIYLNSMLKRTRQNHNLALVLFKKLFLEFPEQITQLETALTTQQTKPAHDIAHKINGSACFCGFNKLQKLSNNLEMNLIAANLPQAHQCFLVLKQEINNLQNLQEKIFQQLEKKL